MLVTILVFYDSLLKRLSTEVQVHLVIVTQFILYLEHVKDFKCGRVHTTLRKQLLVEGSE